MIFRSCHFLFHQFTQGDEPYQIIAGMDALAAFSAAFIQSSDIDRLEQLMGRIRRQFGQICVLSDLLNEQFKILALLFLRFDFLPQDCCFRLTRMVSLLYPCYTMRMSGAEDLDNSGFEETVMLITISEFKDIDMRKLMDIYSESNYENTDYFFPDEADKDVAVQKVEARFLDFLKNDFFEQDGASYWILEENGVWISALRLNRIQTDLYYLEALETRPDQRGKGYASLLLSSVVESLKKVGPFRLCDCVGKKNTASLKTHEKCGFRIVSDGGYDYLHKEADDHDFGLEYGYLVE